MIFRTLGNPKNPAILFFHAMGVTGESSLPVADYLKDDYFVIMPTSTVYCHDQTYISKDEEVRQVTEFLALQNVKRLTLVVASSLGADLAVAFLHKTALPVDHIFFDGGQFAKIPKALRVILTPILYLAIKSLYWSKGKTLKQILWCDDDAIKPYFIAAGKNLTFKNLRGQLSDSVENKPFLALSNELQQKTFFEFGSVEDHFKYREDVIKSYPDGHFPVFQDYNHMQFQIRDPKGFAEMLTTIIATGEMPKLPFLR